MITFIEGILEEKQPTRTVLNAGGVGYELLIPLSTFDRLPSEGSRARLLTFHLVREDDEILFGFATPEERGVFQKLLSVSGVGPKTALAALSGLPHRDLARAVLQGDVKRISSISGIGRKTAERIITDLKDKFSEAEAVSGTTALPPETRPLRDAMAALVALGYKQAEAHKMLQALPAPDRDSWTTEELIRRALAGR